MLFLFTAYSVGVAAQMPGAAKAVSAEFRVKGKMMIIEDNNWSKEASNKKASKEKDCPAGIAGREAETSADADPMPRIGVRSGKNAIGTFVYKDSWKAFFPEGLQPYSIGEEELGLDRPNCL